MGSLKRFLGVLLLIKHGCFLIASVLMGSLVYYVPLISIVLVGIAFPTLFHKLNMEPFRSISYILVSLMVGIIVFPYAIGAETIYLWPSPEDFHFPHDLVYAVLYGLFSTLPFYIGSSIWLIAKRK